MIIIDLHELIKIIPELINMFLPGLIFMSIYGWLYNKSYDISIITIWSLFISSLIQTFYSLIHSLICTSHDFNENAKVMIYVITATVLPIIVGGITKSDYLKNILYKANHKSIHSDIFDDVLDYEKRTSLKVYLKDSNIMYIGSFKYREEKGMESYIVLIDYASMETETKEVLFNPEEEGFKSTVMINLQDVERIEIIYDDDSEVWKKLNQ